MDKKEENLEEEKVFENEGEEEDNNSDEDSGEDDNFEPPPPPPPPDFEVKKKTVLQSSNLLDEIKDGNFNLRKTEIADRTLPATPFTDLMSEIRSGISLKKVEPMEKKPTVSVGCFISPFLSELKKKQNQFKKRLTGSTNSYFSEQSRKKDSLVDSLKQNKFRSSLRKTGGVPKNRSNLLSEIRGKKPQLKSGGTVNRAELLRNIRNKSHRKPAPKQPRRVPKLPNKRVENKPAPPRRTTNLSASKLIKNVDEEEGYNGEEEDYGEEYDFQYEYEKYEEIVIMREEEEKRLNEIVDEIEKGEKYLQKNVSKVKMIEEFELSFKEIQEKTKNLVENEEKKLNVVLKKINKSEKELIEITKRIDKTRSSKDFNRTITDEELEKMGEKYKELKKKCEREEKRVKKNEEKWKKIQEFEKMEVKLSENTSYKKMDDGEFEKMKKKYDKIQEKVDKGEKRLKKLKKQRKKEKKKLKKQSQKKKKSESTPEKKEEDKNDVESPDKQPTTLEEAMRKIYVIDLLLKKKEDQIRKNEFFIFSTTKKMKQKEEKWKKEKLELETKLKEKK